MGNKVGSRHKSTDGGSKKSEVKRRPKKNGSASVTSNSATTREKKVISCPDLSGAVPYKFDDASGVDVTIYRSYSNVAAETGGDRKRACVLAEPEPDIRVYRRSTGNLARQKGGAPDKSQTLPRSFGRNRHSMPPGTQQPGQSNGTLPGERASEGGVQRRLTIGGGCGGGGGPRESKVPKRTLSTSSMASIGYKVHPEDFPDSSTIKRKLGVFESTFARNLTELFGSGLTEAVQMSLLSIAIRPHRANKQVSLWQYLQSDDVPANLDEMVNEDPVEYALTIPQVLFNEVKRIRCENITDSTARIDVAKQILACLAMEAANELSRSFEYQLALMPEGLPMELLGRHGAQCVYEYLKRNNRYLDRNTIVQGVVCGHLKAPSVCPKFSIIIGERELKWNLFEIFKKPGLRKETFLLSCSDIQTDSEEAPWSFFASITSDPMLYGYRGLLVDWDFASSCYRLNGEDEASFPDEAEWRPDDFHRDYCPYRRLIGLGVMREFCRETSTGNKTLALADYVKQIQGRAFARDRIQPVYRPIEDGGSHSDDLPLDRVTLGNADTLRVRRSGGKSETVTQRHHEAAADDGILKRQSDVDVVAMVAVATHEVTSSDGSISPTSKKVNTARNSRTVSPRQSNSTGSPISSSTSEANSPSPPKAIFNSVLPLATKPSNAGFRSSEVVANLPAVSNKDAQLKPNGMDDPAVKNNAPPSGPDVLGRAENVTIVRTNTSPKAHSPGGAGRDVNNGDFLQTTAMNTSCVTTEVVSRRSTITSDV